MAHRRLARIEPLLKIARGKLMRAVDEVVSRHHREQLEELRAEMARLHHEFRESRDHLNRRLEEMDYRNRRDLFAAAERVAAHTSAEYAREHMPTAPRLPDMRATLAHGLKLAPEEGLALEFGVWSGSTLKQIAEARGGRGVYGFDAFEGLPEDWRTGFPVGSFSTDAPPDVPGAELVIGWFDQTLPGFMAEHADEPLAFVHIDCDLYSSTVTVLEHVGPRLRAGSVLVFDEYFNYPGWMEHEHRAWLEFVERTGVKFSYEGYTLDHEQVVVRVTETPN
ncbi:MAG TPA: class I SAM-dependent methyltransferase [Pseudonocardiaceae bacterium]